MKQVEDNNDEEEEGEEKCLQPVNMSFPVVKELNAKWLVGMFDYICEHPHVIVNGFIRAGIAAAFDGNIDSVMHLGKESNTDDEDSDCSDNVGFDSLVTVRQSVRINVLYMHHSKVLTSSKLFQIYI